MKIKKACSAIIDIAEGTSRINNCQQFVSANKQGNCCIEKTGRRRCDRAQLSFELEKVVIAVVNGHLFTFATHGKMPFFVDTYNK